MLSCAREWAGEGDRGNMWTCKTDPARITYESDDGYSFSYPAIPSCGTDQLVVCKCGYEYVVIVDESPDHDMPGVVCPECGAPASDWRSVSTHSSGLFNATTYRDSGD